MKVVLPLGPFQHGPAAPHLLVGQGQLADDLVQLGYRAELGWIGMHPTPFSVPEWMGSWFEIYPYWETIAAQVLAARP